MVADACAVMLKVSKDYSPSSDTVLSPFLLPAAQANLLPTCYEGNSALQLWHILFVMP